MVTQNVIFHPFAQMTPRTNFHQIWFDGFLRRRTYMLSTVTKFLTIGSGVFNL